MSIVQDLIKQGKLVGWWDFRQNTLFDLSGNGGASSVDAGSASWQNTEFGRGISMNAASRLNVSDYAASRIDNTLSLIAYGDFSNPSLELANTSSIAVMIDKRAGAGASTNYYWYRNVNSNSFVLYDGTTSSTYVHGSSLTGSSYGVTVSGAATKPKAYVNGNFAGEHASNVTITSASVDIKLSNGYAPTTYPCKMPTCGYMIFNVALSGEEMSQIHNELESQRGILGPPETGFVTSFPKLENELFSTDCIFRNGSMIDETGNEGTNDVVLGSGEPVLYSSPWGDATKFNGKAYRWDSLGWDFTTTPLTVHSLVKEKKSASLGVVNQYNAGTNKGWSISHTTTSGNNPQFTLSGDSASNVEFGDVQEGTWNLLSFTKPTGASVAYKIYLNGKFVTSTAAVANVPTLASLTIGDRRSTSTTPYTDQIATIKVLNVEQSEEEIAAFYGQIAKHPTYKNDYSSVYPTLANVTAGEIGNTGFRVYGGTWKASEEAVGNKRYGWTEAVGGGARSYRPSKEAYGTWVFKINKGADANTTYFQFMGDVIGTVSATGQNGYNLVIDSGEGIRLQESTSGTATNLFTTASSYIAINTDYLFAVSRNVDGEFTAYIKGGAFTQWTLIDTSGGVGSNPVTDTTTTTSKFALWDIDNLDKGQYLGHHQGVLGIEELSNLY